MSVIKSRYSELLKMLNSTDIDDAILALAIIEENVVPDDLPWLTMLYRNKGITNSTWKENAHRTNLMVGITNYNKYSEIVIGITFSDISDEAKQEGIEFILNQSNKEIMDLIILSGYEKIKSIETTVIPNE
jgi:hypothetical protein